MENIKLLVTGQKWLRQGQKSYLITILDLIDKAQNKIVITTFILNEREIFQRLTKAIKRGILVEIFLHEPRNEVILRKLDSFGLKYSNL